MKNDLSEKWIGVKMIRGVTKVDIPTLAFEHNGSMVVVNWSDVREAHFYEGED
jgi:hypothetical protein